MNIEIANRLVALRKEKKLSQEALANALGISRQAVSKWERAEASPDTDNLILLAKLYGVSLDELLKTNQEEFESGKETTETKREEKQQEDYVHISFKNGIHVKEGDDEVHVGWDGIHIKEGNKDDTGMTSTMEEMIGEEVKMGVYVNGELYDWKKSCNEYYHYSTFPIAVLVSVAYIFIGIVYGAWHPGWLIFGLIPLYTTLVSAIKNRDIMRFAYPVLVLMIIGYYGFIDGMWYPQWLLLLTIPIYYSIFGYLKYKISSHKKIKFDKQMKDVD